MCANIFFCCCYLLLVGLHKIGSDLEGLLRVCVFCCDCVVGLDELESDLGESVSSRNGKRLRTGVRHVSDLYTQG